MHLVIGAGGYAGRHAVAALSAHVLARTAELDDDLAAAMSGVEVVHLTVDLHSPLARGGRTRRSYLPLVSIVDLARRARVRRLVFLSSTGVFGFDREGRVSERTRLRPSHPWARVLAADEAWLRQLDQPDVVVLRAAQGFGPDEPVSGPLLDWLLSRRLPLPGGGSAPRTFLAGPDLGRALYAAAVRGQPGGAYLVGGFLGTWRKLLEAGAAVMAVHAQVRRSSYDMAYLGAITRLRTDAGRTCWPTPYVVDLLGRPQIVEDGWSRRELSWRPEVSSFAAGLAELPDWRPAAAREADAGGAPWPEGVTRTVT